MKFSSSFKVGLLTLLSLVLLVGVVFKVKGRTFSSADRVEIQFKDVNGMRPGAGVQMMGLRVGQVEEITPVIDGEPKSAGEVWNDDTISQPRPAPGRMPD